MKTGHRPRVAFQGELGAFSEEAVRAFFRDSVPDPIPRPDFAEVVSAVVGGKAEFGVLPAENSIHGSVAEAWDVLAASGLSIVDEVVCPIRLCLLARPGTRLDAIEQVISHPVALNQCRRFLTQLPTATVTPVYDTAGAAKEVAFGKQAGSAAVASRAAAERYGLDVLAADIQDRSDNQTRFFLLTAAGAGSRSGELGGGARKVVLVADVAHQPGSLLRILTPFASRGINLTRIESRPADVPWTYHFFIEAATAQAQPGIEDALAEVERNAERMQLLGLFAIGGQASAAGKG
ncbi:MAG: prephenate dehydratase [Longimicrobiales bacterium]